MQGTNTHSYATSGQGGKGNVKLTGIIGHMQKRRQISKTLTLTIDLKRMKKRDAKLKVEENLNLLLRWRFTLTKVTRNCSI